MGKGVVCPGAPEPLGAGHKTDTFHSGEPLLDDWLRRRALANQLSGVSRTFVVHDRGQVFGYFTLAAGGVARVDAPGRLRRNVPDPIPLIVLARLAVDERWQGQGWGVALLKNALARSLEIAASLGVAGVLVHAVSERATSFYRQAGFIESPTQPLTLFMPITAVADAIRG